MTAVGSTGIGALGGKSILDDPQDLPEGVHARIGQTLPILTH